MASERFITTLLRSKRFIFLFRFLATGGLNTAFGTGIYWFLVWITVPPKIALLLGTVISIAFNFVTYGKLAFGGKLKKENIPRFVATYVILYFVNSELLGLLIKLGLSAYLAFVVLIPFILVSNFVLLRYFVFRDRETVPANINRS